MLDCEYLKFNPSFVHRTARVIATFTETSIRSGTGQKVMKITPQNTKYYQVVVCHVHTHIHMIGTAQPAYFTWAIIHDLALAENILIHFSSKTKLKCLSKDAKNNITWMCHVTGKAHDYTCCHF